MYRQGHCGQSPKYGMRGRHRRVERRFRFWQLTGKFSYPIDGQDLAKSAILMTQIYGYGSY
jgi:hypothetical protein